MCFEKYFKGKNFNVFNRSPYLVAYNWKPLLQIQIMTLKKGFYNIPGRNVGQSKVFGCVTLIISINYSNNAINYYFRFKYWRKKVYLVHGTKIRLYRFELFFLSSRSSRGRRPRTWKNQKLAKHFHTEMRRYI